MEGPVIESATDVIWYRFEILQSRVSLPRKTASAAKLQAYRGLALGWNCVETTVSRRLRSLSNIGFPAGFRYDVVAAFWKIACMYRAVTRRIEVTVEPNFLPERSSADKQQYFWSYTIVITNSGDETVQLRTRHWIITDGTGRKQEVRGEGVVGEQPVLAPGERFEYTSGVPLPTASGIMTGRYQMVTESGERFEIEVPTFSLDSPDGKRTLN
jgi:ApaG protein